MQLSLNYFRGNKFSFRMNQGLSVFTVQEIASGQVNLDSEVYLPSLGIDLQRPLVWSDKQEQELILSVLKGIQLPKVALIHYKDMSRGISLYQVIDGKQRLATLIRFVDNHFTLSVEGQDLLFSDLPQDCQREILRLWIVADVAYEYPDQIIPDEEKVRWFNLINFAGTPQDQAHFEKLQNAVENNQSINSI